MENTSEIIQIYFLPEEENITWTVRTENIEKSPATLPNNSKTLSQQNEESVKTLTHANSLPVNESQEVITQEEQSSEIDEQTSGNAQNTTSYKKWKKSKKRPRNKEALANARPTYSAEEIRKMRQNNISVNSKTAKVQSKNEVAFSEGDEVFVKNYKKNGILLKKNKNNEWTVQIGSFKTLINQNELKLINNSTPT